MTVCTVEVPITGVMNATQAVFDSCFYDDHAHNLTWEQFEEDYRRDNNMDPREDMPDEVCECYEADEEEYIFGDWKKNRDGVYEIQPDCNGIGFAAVLGWLGGAPIVHVVWSKTTRRVLAMCSPCCPGQADLDSGDGEILAYDLPCDWYWDGE